MFTKPVDDLKQALGQKVSVAPAILKSHGVDEGSHECALPDAVLFASSTEDIVQAVKICAKHNMPVIPYGAGTSLEGQVIPVHGGLTVDMSQMNRILTVNTSDMDVRVEAGITRKALNLHLRDQGLFFPVDPGANCTLGGMVATRASGTNSVKYGTMREQLLTLKVITANGEIIETGTRARKSAAGYDLTHLFCGSEGTLGIVAEVGLKVYGIPEKVSAGICRFDNLSAAVETVIGLIQLGTGISRVELLDELAIRATNQHGNTDHPEKPTLFLEFSGSVSAVNDQIATFRSLASETQSSDLEFATTQEEINALWRARHQLYYATKALAPGKDTITTDVCVPISRLAECMLETRYDIEKSGLFGSMLGHVGDGNFHTILLIDPGNDKESEQAEKLNRTIVQRALDMGGTCTGEHGIGLGKKQFLNWEKESAVPVMQQIKLALDPANIMNPDKIF